MDRSSGRAVTADEDRKWKTKQWREKRLETGYFSSCVALDVSKYMFNTPYPLRSPMVHVLQYISAVRCERTCTLQKCRKYVGKVA